MNCNKALRRMLLSIIWIIVGIVLFALGVMGILDEFWYGFGSAAIAVGVIQLIRHILYRTNDEYKTKVDVKVNDERNRFLSSQAWAWTGYVFILCCAAAAIVFKITGEDELCSLCATGIGLMVFIYFVTYMILIRKY
ncbi:MAG: hypothetical protein IKB73_07635 [Ruminococcus sp.]|nr:hypothetical protein [Ruminococcus sp.]